MSIILACFSQLWDCVPPSIARTASYIADILPSEIHPIGNSVLLQILVSALYTALLDKSEKYSQNQKTEEESKPDDKGPSTSRVQQSESNAEEIKNSTASFDGIASTMESIALALCESLCSIDEDNKHTEQIEELLDNVNKSSAESDIPTEGCKRVESSQQMVEILASDLLMTFEGKKGLKVPTYYFTY